jgi:hypothetical protein
LRRGRQIICPVLGQVIMSMPFLALGSSFLLSSDAKGSKNELGAAEEETFSFQTHRSRKDFVSQEPKEGWERWVWKGGLEALAPRVQL